MPAPVSPTQSIRAEIDELFAGGGELLSVVEQVARLHVCRKLVAKVPAHAQDQVKRAYRPIFDQIQQQGEAAGGLARRHAKRFIATYQRLYPSAVAGVAANLDALVVHLRFPTEHRQRIRPSNLIERTFGETRRRVKVIGRLPGEQSCLSLVWAVLDRAATGWHGLPMTPRALRRLQDLRRQLLPATRPDSSPRRWSTSPSPPPRSIMSEPASGAVYTAPETPPVLGPSYTPGYGWPGWGGPIR